MLMPTMKMIRSGVDDDQQMMNLSGGSDANCSSSPNCWVRNAVEVCRWTVRCNTVGRSGQQRGQCDATQWGEAADSSVDR